MLFATILIILIGAIAFFHFIQGFFSATLSAIFAVIAAAVAVGYHENVVMMMKPGKFADSATGVILCALFAVTYLVLRILFDRLVPGNVRLLPTIDKIGAAVMGLIAGVFAAGIVAIAAQTLPFGPSVLGYSRYALEPDREVSFQTKPDAVSVTRTISDETKSEKFEEKDLNHLLVPVDDLVLSTVSTLSEGALSGDRKFSAIHEDYLKEAFGNRIGLELGAKATATNFPNREQVTVDKISMTRDLKQVEGSELHQIRLKKPDSGKKKEPNASAEEATLAKSNFKAEGKQVILIVRTFFDKDATDKDLAFRFAPGSVRLVGHDSAGKAKDYFPVGTMDTWGGGTFWPNRISDPLFVKVDDRNGADLVFVVEDAEEVLESAVEPPRKKGEEKPAAQSSAAIKPLTFLEVKRLGRVDLSGKTVERTALPPDPKIEVLRKVRLKTPPPKPQ